MGIKFLKSDPIRPWLKAVEATGDDVMIRFGRVRPGAAEVEWVKVNHADFDGIGGFANHLRSQGVEMAQLPQNTHLQEPSWWPFFKALPKQFARREQLAWKIRPQIDEEKIKDPAMAWHVFSEDETEDLRKRSRELGVSLNSLLLKNLDRGIREELVDHNAVVPWMVPINLRGQISQDSDTQNHISYISVKVKRDEEVAELHREIYRKISRGEHWANWKAYSATRLVPSFLKRSLIRTGRATAEWNLGVFSNLGIWDSDSQISNSELMGAWVFSPLVLRSQPLGAGAMTFQGKLSLTVQAHPELTRSQEVVERWMGQWVNRSLAEL